MRTELKPPLAISKITNAQVSTLLLLGMAEAPEHEALFAAMPDDLRAVILSLTPEHKAALNAAVDEIKVLRHRIWELEAISAQRDEKEKFKGNESPWQTYERLRKIVEQKEATIAAEREERLKGYPQEWWDLYWEHKRLSESADAVKLDGKLQDIRHRMLDLNPHCPQMQRTSKWYARFRPTWRIVDNKPGFGPVWGPPPLSDEWHRVGRS